MTQGPGDAPSSPWAVPQTPPVQYGAPVAPGSYPVPPPIGSPIGPGQASPYGGPRGYGPGWTPSRLSTRRKVTIWLICTVGVLVWVGSFALLVAVGVKVAHDVNRVRMPASAGGLTRRGDKPDLQTAAQNLKDQLITDTVIAPVSGVYARTDVQSEGVMVAAGSIPPFIGSKTRDAAGLLDDAESTLAAGSSVTDDSAVDPGPRGGTMLCERSADGPERAVSLCAWKDSHTAGVAASYDEDVATLAGNVAQMRVSVEK